MFCFRPAIAAKELAARALDLASSHHRNLPVAPVPFGCTLGGGFRVGYGFLLGAIALSCSSLRHPIFNEHPVYGFALSVADLQPRGF